MLWASRSDDDRRVCRMTDALGPLAPGARVAVVAPAGPTPPSFAERAERLLCDWGLQPVLYPSTRASHPRADYLAAPDHVRAADVEDAWCDPAIEGIFCLRGGYGTLRILDLLDIERMRRAGTTPLYGSSDITALLELLRERLGAPGWFTPMIGTRALLDDPVARASLRAAVLEPYRDRCWPAAETLVPGSASGTLIGGNLSLLAMTLGARHRPPVDNAGALVVLEDVHEEAYRLDGYLTSLLRAGWFDGVAGVALGSWKDCAPDEEVRALAMELLGHLGVPLVAGVDIGHGPGARSIPLGVPARLVAPPASGPSKSGASPRLVLGPKAHG